MTTTGISSARRSIATTPRPTIKVQPLTCSIGAELFDVNLSEVSRDDVLFAELKSLLLQYKVVFLRDQDITPQEHARFASRFGELVDHPMAPRHPEAPGLMQIYKSPDLPIETYENAWHSDTSWRATPAMGCVLRCVECPDAGGDTMWANMALAYEKLPESVKGEIASLVANHSFQIALGSGLPAKQLASLRERFPDVEHPVVRTHPETGEKILYVDAFTTHFVNYINPGRVRYGQDLNQRGAELLKYLISQAYIPEYQVRWRWKRNSVAIWDNRATQHYAVRDYPPCVRKMDRAEIAGEKPH